MKKILSFLLVLCVFLLTACNGTATEHEIISDKLGMDVSKGQIQAYSYEYGWFGDGEAYAELVFSDDEFCNSIESNEQWSTLPLTQNLNIVVYGGELPSGDSRESFIKDENGNQLVPTVSNGYYFFEDRQPESKNSKDDTELFDRYSVNFTLAIYDCDTKTLYFYKCDT